MSSLLTAGANKFRRAREWATPTLKDSAFLTRGVLTPEEFKKCVEVGVEGCKIVYDLQKKALNEKYFQNGGDQ